MAELRFVFFDVGNTLLFPNRARILAALPADRHPTLEQWQALERRTKKEFDEGMVGGRVDHSFWWTFHTYLLEEVNLLEDGLRDVLIENTQKSANWDEILRRRGIADCFKSITDSGIVGQEKPHPAVFQAALRAMQAQAAQSLYVGDVYSVDYVGARNAGMQAILFDVAGAYRDRGVERVESLADLESWLKQE